MESVFLFLIIMTPVFFVFGVMAFIADHIPDRVTEKIWRKIEKW